MRNRIGRTLSLITVGISAVVLALVAFAAPSWASGCTAGTGDNVNACAQLGTSLTISGLSGAIDFGAVNAGVANVRNGVENYTVSTNNPHGDTVTITGSDSGFFDGVQSISNADLSVQETGSSYTGEAATYTFSADETAPLTVGNDSTGGADAYSENWTLTPAANAEPGTYTETFTYAVIANA